MIEQKISFGLPKPWNGQMFEAERIGSVSFLVGPNGSGKSRFAEALRGTLANARLLGTGRLEGMSRSAIAQLTGDNFEQGYQKNYFQYMRNAGTAGSGLDAFLILEERPDIRIVVEATLSSLFRRDIALEWDSGFLVPKVTSSRTGDIYRMDRDECHGIRELLVLLTHIHNDENAFLIIDEPELNLHPQFQSFFLQEVRKIAGAHVAGTSRKGVILITHSPFILDLRQLDDLQSVYCFSEDHQLPKCLGDLNEEEGRRAGSLIPRLNVHHKQLFFADSPIFVEGVSDAQLIEAVQERRNASITAAGSCLIDVGGCEEVTKYVELCRRFDKKAFFLFDLDSLFIGSLRQCLRADGSISDFLAKLGLGTNITRYCGELDAQLTSAVRSVEAATETTGVVPLLQSYFSNLADTPKKLARQRVAILIEMAARDEKLSSILGEQLITDIEGRLQRVLATLREKRIYVLPGGALEHYLPSYEGDRYALGEEAKKAAVTKEIGLLATGQFDASLADRYGALFVCIESLPAKPPVDTEGVLRGYVSSYIHELQGIVVSKPQWKIGQIAGHFNASSAGLGRLIQIVEFHRSNANEFRAVLRISGSPPRLVDVSHETNAGMRRFDFRVQSETRAPS